MSGKFIYAFLMVISLTFQAFASIDASSIASQSLNQNHPLYFTENKGQWDEHVLYKAEASGGLTWFIERDGVTLLQSVPDMDAEPLTDPASMRLPEAMRMQEPECYPNKTHALKFKFQNVLPRTARSFLPEQTTPASAASVEPSERLSWNNNYFLGNDPSKWAPDCGNFQQVVMKDVWTGVDVVWRSEGKLVEFDFVVHPNADPNAIRIECLGLTDEMESSSNSEELLLPTSLGVLHQVLPEAFQIEEDGSLAPVRAEFKLVGGNSFGVALPEGYDVDKPLIVDPLVYSTYLGGNSYAYALTPDGAGGVVVAGNTSSYNFPTTGGAFQRNNGGGEDVFISRLNADGSTLIYSTYLGGNRSESANALAPDGTGGVVVAGSTNGNFPTTDGAFDRSHNGAYDAFIARLNADGNTLIYSTYLGGNGADCALALTPDDAGGVVVVGYNVGGNFPTTDGAYQMDYRGGREGFITRLNDDGSALIYSTYLGGSSHDNAIALTTDGAGEVIVTGYTFSSDFTTTLGAYQRSFGGGPADVIIVRLNTAGSVIYSTYLGGNGNEQANGIIPDGTGGVVVAGSTDGNFPTTDGAFDRSHNGNYDAFIARMNAEGSALIYSTYLGGNGYDFTFALTPDGAEEVVVAGYTRSSNFPTTEGAYQERFGGGGRDAFIARLNLPEQGQSALIYSTYLGRSGDELAYALAPDGEGGVVVTGSTNSQNFPTSVGAYQRDFGGGYWNAFITRIDMSTILAAPIINVDPAKLNFDVVEFRSTSSPLTFEVCNIGTIDLTVNSLTLNGNDFSMDDIGSFVLTPGSSQTVSVTFTANSVGTSSGSVEISSDDPDNGAVSVSLLGIGVAPEIYCVPASLNFGNVEFRRASSLTFNIYNWGHANLTVNSLNISGANFSSNDGGSFVLTPYSRKTVSVTYTANSLGASAGSVEITSNDPDNGTVNVALAGNSVWVPSSCLLDRLCERVQSLRIAGVLNQGQANSLCVKTRNSTRHLERNQPDQAIQMLEAFNNEVTAYMQGDVLSEEEGQPLIDGANYIIALITEFGIAGFDDHLILMDEPLPTETRLSGAYPNPFNATTVIKIGLPEDGFADLAVFDLNGRLVSQLVQGKLTAGYHEFTFGNSFLRTGTYFVRLNALGSTLTQKVTLIK